MADMARPLSLDVGGRECPSPIRTRSFSPHGGHTKLDLDPLLPAVADGALRGVAGRPMILKRFVKGIKEEAFFQKRAPRSGRTGSTSPSCTTRPALGEEAVIRDAAAWCGW